MALIAHKIYHINHNINLVRHTDNMCIECMLVYEDCIEHDLYRRLLFSPEIIIRYIWKSKSNIIESQLHHILLDQFDDHKI